MTFRLNPTNHACGKKLWAPRYEELSKKAKNEKKLCKKRRLKNGLKEVERNGNIQLEPVHACRC